MNLYFVFEHCPYGTLSGLIKLNGLLSEETTKIYAAEIINVLERIHTSNVMHRDMKPENILITKDYHLKVVSRISLQ
jgi:3-phosphoinositide dependent protein kinase-1